MSALDQKVILTAEGLSRLKEELTDLKGRARRGIAEQIRVAKELGDLSENAQYHAAKERQSFVEGRIAELEDLIRRASIIEQPKKGSGQVVVGSTVVVHIGGGEGRFTIVGSTEADPAVGLISNESPLGRALLEKKVGDKVQVQAPAGTISYMIKKIL